MTDDVDEVAVERACKGDRSISLNRSETAAAIALCQRRGLSDGDTAELLGITARTVLRVRHGETATPYPRPGAVVDNTKEKISAALKHENVAIRRAAMRVNDDLAKLDRLLSDWDAKEMARERVAELEAALAEAKAVLNGGKKSAAKKPGSGVHAQARAWAVEQGWTVNPKGLVPQHVIDAWRQATSSAA